MLRGCEQINFEELPGAGSEEEYKLHLAALEWSLAEPIVITSREDIKSQVRWRDGFEPYLHQVKNLITFGNRLPVTLLADDVGLGKTISAGMIMAELMERKRLARTLVICPSILGPQWVEELASKFGIPAVFATGQQLDQHLRNSALPVVITTYHTARNRFDGIRSDQFEMIVLDEAHKLRNLHGTPKAPQMAITIKKALENRVFKYVLMLTATPIQNRIWDLYSLIDLLTVAKGHKNPLGTPDQFKSRFIDDSAGRRLNKYRGEEFRSILRQYIVRTRREDAQLLFPERQVQTRRLWVSGVEQRMTELVSETIASLDIFTQISISQAMMSSPQALASQLENMARKGSVPDSVAMEARKLADANLVTSKMNGLLTLVRELRQQRPDRWRMVVFTLRKETQDAISRVLQSQGVKVGLIRGGSSHTNQATVEAYRADPPAVNAIISTDAGAEGINLQAGNVLVNYDLPWNPMVMEQRIGRIQRLASKHQNVIVVNLVIKGSVEERVVGRLMEKLQAVAETIGDIETILESAGQDDESGESFEEVIRKLVVSSLQGQDVEEATKRQVASIDRAKDLMKDERRNLDQVFGANAIEQIGGPRPPKLQPMSPSIPGESFVIRGLTAEGATVRPQPDDTLDVIRPGKPVERITFKPELAEELASGVFMGNAPKLYLPGKPPFERLVQRWLDRSSHLVRDFSTGIVDLAAGTAQSWCGTILGAEFQAIQIDSTHPLATGEVVCRAKAANGVDSLEKLIMIRGEKGEPREFSPELLEAAPFVEEPVSPDEMFHDLPSYVRAVAPDDKDIAAFCDFYDQRRSEELAKAGGDSRLRHKLDADLAPKLFVDVVALRGIRYDLAEATVRFGLDGDHTYSAPLKMIPASRQVIEEPPRIECQVTRRHLPDCCIDLCQISGKPCTKHLLITSEISGRRALPEFEARCGVSGRLALADELWRSEVSQICAAPEYFAESAQSSRRALKEEMASCEFSQTLVLPDELRTSDISGRVFRSDQAATSSVSGRVGHISEFVTCDKTCQHLAPDESGVSAVTHRLVRRDLLIPSEKEPHRLGLEEETLRCAVSGRRLLSDECVFSAVSRKPIDADLAAHSDLSGEPMLPAEVVVCDVTGQRLLPSEMGISAFSGQRARSDLLKPSEMSGRLGLESEFRKCEITGSNVLSDELIESQESGRRFRKDMAVTSIESGKVAHESETVTCSVTSGPILRSESDISSVSGRVCRKALLKPSEKQAWRFGIINEEFETCSKSGLQLLRDEVAQSAISGKWYDRELLKPSSKSGRLALPEELVRCEESGLELLPSESCICSVTGKRVNSKFVDFSQVSGMPALKHAMERCAVTNKRALPIELQSCEESGKRVLPTELGVCAITRKNVLRELLAASELSGETGQAALMERCAVTRKLALPTELRECEVTGKRVCPSELETCSVSRKRVIRDQLLKSDISGVAMLPEYAVRSPLTRRVCTTAEATLCTWRAQQLPADEVSVCRITGLSFARDYLNSTHEFRILRDLLDETEPGTDASDLVRWLMAAAPEQLSHLKSARCVFSPDGSVRAICGELRSMLGLKVRHVGLVVSEDGERRLLGRMAVGRRHNGSWRAD